MTAGVVHIASARVLGAILIVSQKIRIATIGLPTLQEQVTKTAMCAYLDPLVIQIRFTFNISVADPRTVSPKGVNKLRISKQTKSIPILESYY